MRSLATILFALGTLIAVPAFADNADALYKQGLAYKQQGKADDAIAALEKAVAANPPRPDLPAVTESIS